MKILIACEESQAVTARARAAGHEAWSCDIAPCSGGHPEWHLQQDVRPLLREPWDVVIAFPPCTHLASSGARWFREKRAQGLQQTAIEFAIECWRANAPRVAIENPVGVLSTAIREPDQVIQPWQFGHGETKATCLWLRGLPLLQPTEIVEGREPRIWRMPPSADRARLRSQTYAGVADAMVAQWLRPDLPLQLDLLACGVAR
jgi:hypothetical protein